MNIAACQAMFAAQSRRLLQYRAAAIMGALTQFTFGWIRVGILTAFYQSSRGAAPPDFDLTAAIDYVWISQCLYLLVPWDLDPDLEHEIRSGEVSKDLLRPVDAFSLWYARALARRGAPALLRGTPLALLCFGLGLLTVPESWQAPVGFALAAFTAMLVSAAITTCMSLTLLWTVAGQGMTMLGPTLGWLLSGIVLPLPLFPDWAQSLMYYLPFRALIDTPVKAWTGTYDLIELLPHLVQHWLWIIALLALGHWMARRGLRAMSIAGG